MSSPKRQLAWECRTDDPDDSQIVWAASPHEAMESFDPSRELENSQAVRSPSLDAYAPGPAPYEALLELGWYVHCEHCGRKICYDDTDDWVESLTSDELREISLHNARIRVQAEADEARDPGSGKDRLRLLRPRMLDRRALRFVGRETVFCNVICEQDHHRKHADDEIRAQGDESDARAMFPFALEITALRYPCTERIVRIGFGGTASADWIPGEEHVHVQKKDVELWERLVTERDERAGRTGEEN